MKRVLVVDDDVDTLESLSTLLADKYDVFAAGNGAEAVFATTRHEFAAIVLDLTMPILDGEGVVEELRARNVRAPIILASASLDIASMGKKLGVADYLAKPFDLDVLEEKLERLVEAPRPSSRPPGRCESGAEPEQGIEAKARGGGAKA